MFKKTEKEANKKIFTCLGQVRRLHTDHKNQDQGVEERGEDLEEREALVRFQQSLGAENRILMVSINLSSCRKCLTNNAAPLVCVPVALCSQKS